MEYSLKNKVVVVTGGAKGIGGEIVDKYLEQEAKVAIVLDIDEKQGNEKVKILTKKYGEGKAEFIKCDVTTDLELVSKIIMLKYKTVDVLVLNAGRGDFSEPRRAIYVFITAAIEWSLKFLEYIRKDKGGNGGTFIIISSIFGFRTLPFVPIYQASKFAVLGFAKSLGHDYNFDNTGVRVVALCPGFTETQITLLIHDPEVKIIHPNQDFITFADAHPWQEVKAVGKAAVEVFKKARSGTVWIIEGGNLTESA